MNYKPQDYELKEYWTKAGFQCLKLEEAIKTEDIKELQRITEILDKLSYKIKRHHALQELIVI